MSNRSCDVPKRPQNMGEATPPYATPSDKLVTDYLDWLRNHRGGFLGERLRRQQVTARSAAVVAT